MKEEESYKDSHLVFHFGLFKKQKPKKKKIPTNNFIYKVELKPWIMERGNYGKWKGLGQGQYHILNIRARERSKCWFFWQVGGSWDTVFYWQP